MISKKSVYADDICRYIKTEINPYGKPFQGSAYELGLKLMKYIERMPSAYDVDRVVEQLENSAYWTESTFDEDGYSNDDSEEVIELQKAIEIVKAGGVNA